MKERRAWEGQNDLFPFVPFTCPIWCGRARFLLVVSKGRGCAALCEWILNTLATESSQQSNSTLDFKCGGFTKEGE